MLDDEEELRWTLEELLQDKGLEVVTVGDRRGFERLIREQAFDIAVVDYQVPLEDRETSTPVIEHGLGAMHAAKAAGLPFVVLTGVAKGAQEGVLAAKAGVEEYFLKTDVHALRKLADHCVKRCAERKKLRKELAPDDRLPLVAKSYAECRVVIGGPKADHVLLALVGSTKAQVRVKPPKISLHVLWDLATDQAQGAPSTFPRWEKDSTTRTYVSRARRWLRERFQVEAPAHPDAPLVSFEGTPGTSAWTCDIRVVLVKDPERAAEREALFQEAAKLRQREFSDE